MSEIENGISLTGYNAVKDRGFIGSTPLVNYTIHAADGSVMDGDKKLDYESEIYAELLQHNKLLRVSNKEKELKRHIGTLASIDAKYGKFNPSSSADGGSTIGQILNTAKDVLIPKTPDPVVEPQKNILGMPAMVFYTIVGILVLTAIVLIIKHNKK